MGSYHWIEYKSTYDLHHSSNSVEQKVAIFLGGGHSMLNFRFKVDIKERGTQQTFSFQSSAILRTWFQIVRSDFMLFVSV